MVVQRNEKLNQLQRILPGAMVADSAWLESQGYSKSLRAKYLAAGWLERVAPGVYRRPQVDPAYDRDAILSWEAVVASLQLRMGRTDMHVGGMTALEVLGFAHYTSRSSKPTIQLYSARPLPAWLLKVPVAEWSTHTRSLFTGDASDPTDVRTDSDSFDERASFDSGWIKSRYPIRRATPERAILELIDELPKHQSFEQVDMMLGGLSTLRPRLLQNLLERCTSIKVKRLFLFLAERHNHAWFKHLTTSNVTLGVGKRALVAHGRYDAKYRITVPAFLLSSPNDY